MWGSIGMMICLFIVGALIQGKSSFLLRLRILNIIMAYLLILCLMSFLQSSLSNSLCILLPILLYSSLSSLHLHSSSSSLFPLSLCLFLFLPFSSTLLLPPSLSLSFFLPLSLPLYISISLSLSLSLSLFPFLPLSLLHLLLRRCQALMSLKSIRPIVSLSLSCYSLSTFPTPTAL